MTDHVLSWESSVPHPRVAEEPRQWAHHLEPASLSLPVWAVDQGKDEDPPSELTVGDQESVLYSFFYLREREWEEKTGTTAESRVKFEKEKTKTEESSETRILNDKNATKFDLDTKSN